MDQNTTLPKNRLLSLDAYRGVTMFLLMAEAAFVYHAFTDYFLEGTLGASIIQQFHHHPWNGLRFWDLIQPFFMFICLIHLDIVPNTHKRYTNQN